MWDVVGGRNKAVKYARVLHLIEAPPATPGSRVCLGLKVPSISHDKVPCFSAFTDYSEAQTFLSQLMLC